MNTAIEKTVDLVSPTFNPKAGLIKDISAGAVLVCAIVAAIIGVLIFLPKI
jgi:diacylglycerol kinase